jgi:hypothetical protein
MYRKALLARRDFLRSNTFKDGTTSLGGIDFSKTVQK